jgi:hypothetical protein
MTAVPIISWDSPIPPTQIARIRTTAPTTPQMTAILFAIRIISWDSPIFRITSPRSPRSTTLVLHRFHHARPRPNPNTDPGRSIASGWQTGARRNTTDPTQIPIPLTVPLSYLPNSPIINLLVSFK